MNLERLPWRFRLANQVGRWLGASRLKRARFDLEPLSEEAFALTGLSDFGDPGYREGLAVLLESLEDEACLHPIGRFGMRGMILTQLTNRLRFVEQQRRDVSREVQLIPPLIILGMPRSGTTFLHRLIAENEAFRYLSFWELMRPFPGSEDPDERKERVARALETRLRMNPNLDRKHFIRADSPEECIWLLNLTFVSHAYWVAAPAYSYLDWLNCTDRTRAYREYRKLLEYFQSQQPGKRLLLKAPSHTGSVQALLSAIPEALIVQCHRDPVEVLGSFNSLIASVHRVVSDRVEPRKMARANLEMLLHEDRLNERYRKEHRPPIHDVFFPDLMRDPIGVVRTIYDTFQLDWCDRLDEQAGSFLAINPRGKHGIHRYSNEEFGETAESVAERFRSYRSRFGFDG
ncbi:MAG: sulfotransferase [Acidobacteriota bacterium]|nr:MAG: sulfotransferase [Acidobacteriota bacterium]